MIKYNKNLDYRNDKITDIVLSFNMVLYEVRLSKSSHSVYQMDGFEQDKRIVVIAATNRKQDLDPALLR
jgi:hypothetical protein